MFSASRYNFIIFTDGASRGNPGPGGWAAVIVYKLGSWEVKEIGGREERATNNRMELRAAIEALSYVVNLQLTTYNLQLFTDSGYLINGITKWVFGWQKNGWKTKGKKDVENRDLWEQLTELTLVAEQSSLRGAAQNHAERTQNKIEWRLVGGHVGVVGNTRCDEIATAFADLSTSSRQAPPKLYSGILENYGIKNILDISGDAEAKVEKRESKRRQQAKAYSYVSLVGGKVETHKTWAECEKRVKRKSGAKYKKVFSAEEEKELIAEWIKR